LNVKVPPVLAFKVYYMKVTRSDLHLCVWSS